MKHKAVCDPCRVRYEWSDRDIKSSGVSDIAFDTLRCILCDGPLVEKIRQNYVRIRPGDMGLQNMTTFRRLLPPATQTLENKSCH